MERLIQQPTLLQADLISCNRYRLALEAVTLADIVTSDGKRVQADVLGAHPSFTHQSKWAFPVEKPSPTDIDRWHHALSLLTSASYELAPFDVLGPWIVLPHREWEWFYSPPDGMLFRHVFQAWHRYIPTSQHITHHRTFQ
jgi:hypothetical protein